MPSIADILAVCSKHKSNRLYVAPIPNLQLTNARVALSIPPEEEVIALANLTFFGSCKDAMAFCSGGIYMKNLGTARDYLPWDELRTLTFVHVPKFFSDTLTFSDGRSWDIGAADTAFSAVIPVILRSLQDLSGQSHSAVAAIEWHVAVHQQQFGPYDTDMLKSLVANGQLDSTAALVWREGMANWSPFHDVQEFKALPFRPSAAPPIPGPPSGVFPIDTSQPVLAEAVKSRTDASESPVAHVGVIVDLNNALLDDLLHLPGLTLAAAKQLVQERQSRLGFQTIEEVGELLGLPPHKVQRLRERVRLEPFAGTGHITSARRRLVDF